MIHRTIRKLFGFETNQVKREQMRTLFRPRMTQLEERAVPALLWVDSTPSMAGTEFTATGGTQPASVTGLTPGTDIFLTIQDAVNAASAGDTINVSNGTYTETVGVNTSVTLRGNQFGVDPNDASWNDTRTVAANETIIHGAVNLSLRNDIVLDGFTIERTATNEGHILIGSSLPGGSGTSSSFDILNNRIIGTRSTPSPGSPWAGIHTNFLNDVTQPGAQFLSHQNRIEIAGTASGSGILVNANLPGTDGLGQTTITETYVANSPGNGFNVNRPGASATITGNRAVNDDIFTFRANNTLISGNTISDAPQAAISNTGGSTNWTASNNTIITPRAQAVLVGSTFTVDPVTNITIADNTVTVDPSLIAVGVTTVFSPFQYAFFDMRGNMTGTNLVDSNDLTLSSNPLNPAVVAVYGLRVRGNVGNLSVTDNTFDGGGVGGAGDATLPPSSGVFVDTDMLTSGLNLQVTENFIDGWVNGVSIFDTVTGGSGLPAGATIKIQENSITDNMRGVVVNGAGDDIDVNECNIITGNTVAGLEFNGTGILNAEHNFWGSVSGPMNASNPGGTGDAVIGTGSVDFTPWAADASCTSLVFGPLGSAVLLPDPCDPPAMALYITGTSGNDQIQVKPKGTSVEVKINNSTSTFAANSFIRIIVFGLDGNDHVQIQDKITKPAWLFGGNDNDHLQSGDGDTLMIGGAGNDHLQGRKGRDILIGGMGGDHLQGDGGEDILIGGFTDWDDDFDALAITDEWSSTDPGEHYHQRVANLQGMPANGTPPNTHYLEPYLLTGGPMGTVHDDGVEDQLNGGNGLDWYFARLVGPGRDKLTGPQQSGEIVTVI